MLSRDTIKYIIIFFLIGAFFSGVYYFIPEKEDWSLSFSYRDKIPFGTYASYTLLNDISLEKTKPVFDSAYHVLQKNIKNSTYVIVTNVFNPDKYDVESILDFVNSGNTAFISARTFSPEFKNKLNFSTYYNYSDPDNTLNFFDGNKFEFTEKIERYSLSDLNKFSTIVLAENSLQRPVLIKISYGSGWIYLNTTPLIFSNYEIVNSENKQYLYKMFSLIKNKNILWDEFYKENRSISRSALAYIKRDKSLGKVYILTIVFLLLFVLFRSKRVQRIIPVINPKKNDLLEYIQNSGYLAFSYKNNRKLIEDIFFHFSRNIEKKYNTGLHDVISNLEFLAHNYPEKEKKCNEFKSLIKELKANNKVKDVDLLKVENFIYEIGKD